MSFCFLATNGFHVKTENDFLCIVVIALNMKISHCCLADYTPQKKNCHTYSTIIFPHSTNHYSFVTSLLLPLLSLQLHAVNVTMFGYCWVSLAKTCISKAFVEQLLNVLSCMQYVLYWYMWIKLKSGQKLLFQSGVYL